LIFGGELRLETVKRPLDGKLRVIPPQGMFALGSIECGALVEEVGIVLETKEAMC
jgi:hypothetical protein